MATINDFSGGVDSTLATQPAKRAAFNANQTGQTNDFLSRYKGAIGGQETMSAMADRIGQELNLPTLRNNAQQVNETVSNLPYTYGSATRGFDVNANQLARTIGQKTYELTPALNSANSAVSNAEGQLSTRLGYGQADQNKQLLPYQSEQSLMGDRLAREATGFNQDSESELQGYMAKLTGGIQLSEGEANRAEQLAQAKLSYDAQMKSLEQNNAQFKTTSGQDQQKIDLQRQQNLMNLASSFNR